ncbi:MAG: SPFH domain-containing protein [Patescibacteria group bacterium]
MDEQATDSLLSRLYARMSKETKRSLLALATTILLAIALQLWLHNPLFTVLGITISFLAWGIRVVPQYNNALLVLLWVRRTRIGFSEGMVWVPWFFGARLEYFDVRKRCLQLPEEDNWTSDRMHLLYDIVLQYGVTPIMQAGIIQNFFQFFVCAFQGVRNANSLYFFSNQMDLESVVAILRSMTANLTVKAVNSRSFAEVFQQSEEGQPQLKRDTIQEQVITELNQAVAGMGLQVYAYNLEDVDLHPDSAAVVQQKFLAKVSGEAAEIMAAAYGEAAKNLGAQGPDVANVAVRLQVAHSLTEAAKTGGVLELLLQALAANVAKAALPQSAGN